MANQNFKVKKGLEVGTAFTATSDGLNVTGIITATQFSGDGSGLTGVTAAGSGVVVQEEGSNVGTAATINFIGSNVTAAISGGVASVTITGGSSDVVSDTTPQLGGNLDLNSKNITGTGSIAITGGLNATGVSTFQDSVTFQSHALFGDSDKAVFGAGQDLQIYHNGTDSIIADVGEGNLNILGDADVAIINAASTEYKARFTSDGAAELYYNGNEKLETTGVGVTVFGTTQTQQLNVSGVSTFVGKTEFTTNNVVLTSTNQLRFGGGENTFLYYGTDSNSYLQTNNNEFRIGAPTLRLQSYSSVGFPGENYLVATKDGSVDLYYDNSKKFETTGIGVTVFGKTETQTLKVSGISSTSTINVGHNPSTQGSGSILKANELNLTGPNSSDSNSTYYSNIRVNKVGGGFKYDLEFHSNGYSSGDIGDFIFYRRRTGSQRTERMRLSGETGNLTVTGAGSFVGVVTATSFSGSGSALTGLTGASAGTYGASTNTPIITVDSNGRITGIATVATAGAGGGGGISNIVEDTTPQLGGNLDLNSKDITGSGNIDYTGNLKVTGISTITGVAGFSSHITLPDHAEIQVGNATGGDLRIYHNSSDSYVRDSGQGGLYLTGSIVGIKNAAANETGLLFTENGAVSLYYNNALKLATKSDGVDITGELQCDSLDVDGVVNIDGSKVTYDSSNGLKLADSTQLRLGTGNDLRIYHDGSNSYIRDAGDGGLFIQGSGGGAGITIEDPDGNDFIKCIDEGTGGTVELYKAGSKKLETTTTGVTVTGTLAATAVTGDGSGLTGIAVTTTSNIQATWSVTANGSSAYRFTGPGNDAADDNPDLYLVKGQRYRFINNSGGSHPFQIRASVGGSAYSAGVTNNGAASGNIEWNVQHDAPARLYYQCTAHSGMVGNIYITGGGQWQNTSVAASGTPEIYTDYNVGVGTANPGERLHLTTTSGNCKLRIDAASAASVDFYNSGTRFSDMFTDASTGNFTITNRQNADIIFRTNGTNERLRIKSGGNVGIGTDTVTRGPLHIHQPSTSDCQIHLTNNNTGTTSSDGLTIFTGQSNGDCGFVSRESGGSIEFYTHNGSSVGQRLRITSAGNVGINEADPYYKLHMVFSNATTSLSGGSNGNWGSDGIRIENTNTTVGSMALAHFRNYDADWHIGSKYVASNNSNLVFLAEGSEKLRIDVNGNVKIGTIADTTNAVTNCPVYIAMQTDLTDIQDGEGGASSGLVRLEETGSNNGRYHGIDLRNTNSGDIRILNQDVGVSDRGDLVIAMPDGDANDGVHNKIRFNSRESSIQISGKGGAVAADGDVNHTDIYIATKTGVTAVDTGVGGEIAGLIRFEDIGSNNNRYHGIEIRNRNSGDSRILNLDEGTTNKSSLVFAIDNDGIEEAMRIASDGDVRIGDYNSVNRNAGLSINKSDARLLEMRCGSGTETNYVKRYAFQFIRSTSENTVNLCSLGSVNGNSHVVIEIKMYAVCAVADQAAIITAYAHARQQSPASTYTYQTQTPTAQFIVGTGIGVGSLSWSNGVLRYSTDANNNYTKYNTEITAWAHDRMDIGFY